jgi:hypothetical protein
VRTVNAATLKRLEELSRQRATVPPGVLAVPAILDPDTWEKEAMASQQQLSRDTAAGVTTP